MSLWSTWLQGILKLNMLIVIPHYKIMFRINVANALIRARTIAAMHQCPCLLEQLLDLAGMLVSFAVRLSHPAAVTKLRVLERRMSWFEPMRHHKPRTESL